MTIQLLGVSAASAFQPGDFQGTRVTGSAWGAQAKLTHTLLPALSLGKLALQVLPCRPPGTGFNTVASAKLPGTGSLASLGVVTNQGESTATASNATVVESSTVANVSLLSGLIQATTVKASATTTRSASGKTNVGDTDFVDLVVGGTTIVDEVAPNTSITLLGGSVKVVLNEQKVVSGKFLVNAIHVYLANHLGYTGDILVAHAETNLVVAAGQLSGHAYLSYVKLQAGDAVNPVLKALSGRQNVVYLPCGGGDKFSDAAALSIPGANGNVLTSATSHSTVSGTINASAARSYSTHTVQGLSLLAGRITAEVVKTEALTESFAGGVRSEGKTTLTNLRIDGVLYATATANLNVNLPGIGSVKLNEQHCADDQPDTSPCTGAHFNSITVNALHVRVNTSNSLLPLNAEVIVGAAHSGAGF